MKKTLIVSYTPRTGSYTRQLLDEFIRLSENNTRLTHLDLVNTPPDLLLAENIDLIMKWNAGQRTFTKIESQKLSNHHELIQQIVDADHIVVACPIYNFSLPATVKAWIDAIVVSDKTFSFSPGEGFKGLLADKKAMILMVSGFDYNNLSNKYKEFATQLIKSNFEFMGISSEFISAFGVDEKREEIDSILNDAKQNIEGLIKNWY